MATGRLSRSSLHSTGSAAVSLPLLCASPLHLIVVVADVGQRHALDGHHLGALAPHRTWSSRLTHRPGRQSVPVVQRALHRHPNHRGHRHRVLDRAPDVYQEGRDAQPSPLPQPQLRHLRASHLHRGCVLCLAAKTSLRVHAGVVYITLYAFPSASRAHPELPQQHLSGCAGASRASHCMNV